MDVVLTVEVVGVLGCVIDSFNLNRCVEQVVLSTAHVGDSGESLKGLDGFDMNTHRDFTHGDGPNVEVVHVDDVFAASLVDVYAQLFQVEGAGGTLHHHVDATLDDRDRCEDDDDREEVRADGVHPPESVIEVNNRGSDDDTNAHNHVSEHVQISGVDIDVHWLCVCVINFTVAMVVAVVVSCMVVCCMVVTVVVGVVVAVAMSVSVIVTSMIVVILSTQMVVSLTRVQDLNLNQVEA